MADQVVMSAEEIDRSLRRISHELVEQHKDLSDLLLVGIRTRGVPLANRVADILSRLNGVKVPVGVLDIQLYRDDLSTIAQWPLVMNTEIPVGVADRNVVLFDDVLFTGRTIRAALDALTRLGRPKRVQLAVLVDRGHRELPIRADYVGRNVPTSLSEIIKVKLMETDQTEEVLLTQKAPESVAGTTI